MKTREEIEQALDAGLPEGAQDYYQEGAEAMALWILGVRADNPLDEG